MLRTAALLLIATTIAAQSTLRGEDLARDFFAKPGVIDVRIMLQPEARQQLRDQAREYAHATMVIDGDDKSFADVGVKLKGAAGSFRKIDERPGFTINLGKWGGEARLHGLKRLHLNNGVQDDSRLCEWLGNELFAAAGYPAPRVSHAHVWLDGEDLGIYVLREAFDSQFLARVFGDAHGNLYDGGFCRDLDEELEKDEGDGPDDHSDLQRLTEACRQFDPERPAVLAGLIDIEAFVDFMALEAMVGHWDGYCQNRNNFRLWCDAAPGCAKFLPHGMDQIFGEADASVLDHPSAIVASAVSQRAEWRKRYRKRLTELLPLLSPKKLRSRIEARAQPLRKALRGDDERRQQLERAVAELIERVESRYRFLERHVKEPDPKPLTFRGTSAMKLTRWNPAAETSGVSMMRRGHQGVPALHVEIAAAEQRSPRRAAYRTTVLLARGRYRLAAITRTDGIAGLVEGGGGARLKVDDTSSEVLVGDQRWRELHCEFEVGEFQRSVELRLEVEAADGKVWFRIDSLSLQRLGDGG